MVQQKFVINPTAKDAAGGRVMPYVKIFLARLGKRKTITQLQSEVDNQNELKRTLGTFQLLALGIGGIIGE